MRGLTSRRHAVMGLLSVSGLLAASLLVAPVTARAEQGGIEVEGQAPSNAIQVESVAQSEDPYAAGAQLFDDPSLLPHGFVSNENDSQPVTAEPLSAEASRNGIPTVTIFVDESDQAIANALASDPENKYGTWDEVINAPEHSVRGIGSVAITVPEGYKCEYGDHAAPEGLLDLEFIRGRGNSTWKGSETAPSKKAFKFKLADKCDLFGMGASKEWALMANAYDETLLHNRVTSWLAEQIGMPYVPQMVPVDVAVVRVKDGKETGRTRLGSYCLSELVDIEEGRLDIGKLKKNAVADEDITGGYLLSIYNDDQNADVPASDRVFLRDKTLFFQSPEFESDDLSEGRAAQRDYMRGYLEELEQLILGDDYQGRTFVDDDRHDAIAEMMDLRSFADYFWMQEFGGNTDSFKSSSNYLYKPKGGKLCWGPVWDFDLAWRFSPEGYGYGASQWLGSLRHYDPKFAALLRDRWSNPKDGMNAKLEELTRPGGKLDQYRDEMRASWEEDAELNPVVDGYYRRKEQDPTFDAAIERLRTYVDKRRAWVNDHLDDVASRYVKLSYVVGDRVVKQECVDLNDKKPSWPEDPVMGSYEFVGWCIEGTDEVVDQLDVTEDTVFVAKFKEMDLGQTGVPEDACFFPNEVLFMNGGGFELASGGSVAYRASVLLPDVPGHDWSDSSMTFTVRPRGAAVAKKQGKTVEMPFKQATKSTGPGGRTILTFELPLSAIEMGQTVESEFSYTLDGKPCTETHEETLEGQIKSYVDWGNDVHTAYAKALHDFGRTAYDFFRTYGNGNVTADKYGAMTERYTETFDWEATRAGLKEELAGIGETKQLKGSGVKKIGMSLRCDSDTTVDIVIEAKEGVRDFTAHATYKGKRIEGKRLSDTKYRIRVTGVRAQDLGELIEVGGTADGDYSMRCSALSYAYGIMEKDAYGACGNDFMSALYNYHKAAQEDAK